MENEVITLGKLINTIQGVKKGLDPDTLATWYRIIENEAKDRCPEHLKDTITVRQDPVLWMKFDVKASKRAVGYLLDAINSNLENMPFATKLYFQKLEDIIIQEVENERKNPLEGITMNDETLR